jgi:sulfur relay (sulfurtransferase) DsrC/TusE family protein
MDYTRRFYGEKQISPEVRNTVGMVKKSINISKNALWLMMNQFQKGIRVEKFQCSASKDSFSERDPGLRLRQDQAKAS